MLGAVFAVGQLARRALSGVSLYVVALLLPRAVRLVTLPLVVRAVSPAVYGSFATLWPVLGLLHAACDLGLGTAALRLAPEEPDAEGRRRLFSTLVAARAVLATVAAAVGLALAEPLTRALLGSTEHVTALRILVAGLPFVSVFDALADEMRAREAHRTVAGFMVARTLLANGATVALVVVAGLGANGLVAPYTLAGVAILVGGLLVSGKGVTARPRREELRRLLSLGVPFGFLYLLATLRELDRVLVGWLTSVEHVAAYDLAMRVVAPVSLGNMALALVLEPHLYRHAHAPETPRFVDLFVRTYAAGSSVLSMALTAVAPELFALLAPASYGEGVVAFPPLVFGYVADGLLRTAGLGADLAQRTRVWVAGSLTSLATAGALTVLLVPRVGIAGAGAALLVGMLGAAAVTYALARQVSPLRVPLARSALVVVAGAALGGAVVGLGLPLAARLAAFAVYSVAAFAVVGVRPLALLAEQADAPGGAPAP